MAFRDPVARNLTLLESNAKLVFRFNKAGHLEVPGQGERGVKLETHQHLITSQHEFGLADDPSLRFLEGQGDFHLVS